MLLEDESYDKFNYCDINNLSKFNYKFSLNDRFIHVKDNDGNYFGCQTPFLKVLKPLHVTLNKKKTVAKKYLILETNDELDFNNQIGEFMFIINKIHEISQEKIKEKSIEWFNTEFDEIGLDIKVKRPIDQQKESEFIRLSIPHNIESEISKLSKETYVLCNIIFKGLKLSNDYINEEWEIVNLITQEKYEEEQRNEFINNTVEIDAIQTLLDHIIDENTIVENTIVENTIVENTVVENTFVENNVVEINKDKIISDENNYIQVTNEGNKILIGGHENVYVDTTKDISDTNNTDNINNIETNEIISITENLNEIKVKKHIKKNKIIGERILEKKINKNDKKYGVIKKSSKKIIFN
jgi:hypothetical protein